jgi:ribokinase
VSAPRRLLLAGSVLADIRMTVDRLPDRGGDQIARRTEVQSGGGFNVLVAAVRNGLPAALAGRHGSGPFGQQVRRDLAAHGIPALLPPATDADTGFAITLIEPDGERTFVTSPGAESRLTAQELATIHVHPDDALYLSGYDLCYPDTGPALARWIGTLPAATVLVFDPGPMVPEIPADLLKSVLDRVDVLTLNLREAGLLTGSRDPEAAATRLAGRVRNGTLVVLRRGADGSTVLVAGSGLDPATLPAPSVTAVDTTGAGDAHTGILLAGLAQGLTPIAAVRRAGIGAALSVTRDGSATAPTADEIDRFAISLRRSLCRRERWRVRLADGAGRGQRAGLQIADLVAGSAGAMVTLLAVAVVLAVFPLEAVQAC